MTRNRWIVAAAAVAAAVLIVVQWPDIERYRRMTMM
jgi:uncharacterized protein DUF6893